MTTRLDNRKSLYGEPRLSDAQVIALRALSQGKIYRSRAGYRSRDVVITAQTIDALERQLLVETAPSGCCGVAGISCRGRRVLAEIDKATA